jgi:sRNA-binding protein
MLVEHYPKSFFELPSQRVPLKRNIIADILKDKDFKVAPEMLAAGLDWYINHYFYDRAEGIIGSKRFDLNGHTVAVVTEREALAARKRYGEKAKLNAEREQANTPAANTTSNPVKVLNKMYADNQISDDVVKKQDAPPMHKNKMDKTAAIAAPEFATLNEVLANANAAVLAIPDPIMKAVVFKATLDMVIKKAEQVRTELSEGG